MRYFGRRPEDSGCLHQVALLVVAFVAASSVVTPAFSQSLSTEDAARREAAVVAARSGDYAEPIATLESLRSRYPTELSLSHDLATILAWAEEDARVVAVAESLIPENAPRYTQMAVAKSARNVQRFDLAATWYDAAIATNPVDVDALSGRLMTAADAGNAAEVRGLIATTNILGIDHIQLELATGYSLRSIGDLLPALSVYDSVLELAPEHPEALRGKALVLRAMLLPTQALALAERFPGILTDDEVDRLNADEAAIAVRLTSRTPYPEPDVYVGWDNSLSLLDQTLRESSTAVGRDALLLDRVVALSDANEAEEAIAQFEALPSTANRDQVWLLAAAAKAYLQARQPEEAVALLERARVIDPDNIGIQFSLIFAWLDVQRFADALALAEELAAKLPMVNQIPGSQIVKGNENWLRASLLAGMAEAYADQLDAAQARFESLLRAAPNNSELRHELANVYRWRGWVDRSLEQYRQVLATEDDYLGAEIGHVHAQIDARDYPAAAESVSEISMTYNREPAVQQLAKRWDIYNSSELSINASTGDSTGPISGSNNYMIDARWSSAPIAYRYRALITTHDAYAEFPEGESRRRRVGAGVEYIGQHFTVQGWVSGSRDDGDPGFGGNMEYRVGDFWSFGAGLQSNSDWIQPRAHRQGIETDFALVRARFAPSELASTSLRLEEARYSDENVLQNLILDGRFRFLNRPRSKLEATGELTVARAEISSAPYFSPRRNQYLIAGLTHEYRIFRRYERELKQVLRIGTGRHEQDGFDPGSIWSVRYRIDFKVSDRLALSIGAERLGQFFDGVREHTTTGTLSVTGRF